MAAGLTCRGAALTQRQQPVEVGEQLLWGLGRTVLVPLSLHSCSGVGHPQGSDREGALSGLDGALSLRGRALLGTAVTSFVHLLEVEAEAGQAGRARCGSTRSPT